MAVWRTGTTVAWSDVDELLGAGGSLGCMHAMLSLRGEESSDGALAASSCEGDSDFGRQSKRLNTTCWIL